MTSRIPLSNREQLELTFAKSEYTLPEPVWRQMPRLATILQPVWQGIVSVLAPLDGPRVKPRNHADGSLEYLVCDPMTGARYRFSSEESLRVWLDQRYRH